MFQEWAAQAGVGGFWAQSLQGGAPSELHLGPGSAQRINGFRAAPFIVDLSGAEGSIFSGAGSSAFFECRMRVDSLIRVIPVMAHGSCDPLNLLQGPFGPFRPRVERKVQNGFLASLGSGGLKSPERSPKEKTCSTPWLFGAL